MRLIDTAVDGIPPLADQATPLVADEFFP